MVIADLKFFPSFEIFLYSANCSNVSSIFTPKEIHVTFIKEMHNISLKEMHFTFAKEMHVISLKEMHKIS